MIRKARAVWHGTGRAGNGELSSDSGVLSNTAYSFRTRFENEKGTNPEELIAAAHAGCFTMALAFQLQKAGYTPTELSTEAAVSRRGGLSYRPLGTHAARPGPESLRSPVRSARQGRGAELPGVKSAEGGDHT